MLDKLKQLAESIKQIALYIMAPLLVLGGAIYYLFAENRSLKDEVKAKDGDEKLEVLKGEEIKVDSGANDVVGKYERLLEQYNAANLPGGSPGVQPSDQGPTEPDKH